MSVARRCLASCEGHFGKVDRVKRGLRVNFWKKFYPWPLFFCTLPPRPRRSGGFPRPRFCSGAALDPRLPFPRDHPHHIGEVRPLVAPTLLDGDEPPARGRAQRVPRRGDAHSGPRRDLSQGQDARASAPHGVGDDPQRRQLAGRELAGELRRHRAGRRQRCGAARSTPAGSGDRAAFRLGGKWLGRPAALACAATCGARTASRSIPLTSRRRASIASERLCACSSVNLPSPQSIHSARQKPSSMERDFVPPIAVSKSNAGWG